MPLDPRARRFLDLIAASARDAAGSEVDICRRATAALAEFALAPPPVERSDFTLSCGVRARAYAPPGAGVLPGLVYFHGGGLVSGDLDSHDALTASLAVQAGCRLIAVDYRLAPEHRFPAAHDDAVAALQAIAGAAERFAIDPSRLGVGGDSAGGGLAVHAARLSGVKLKLLFLLCPALDPLPREPSRFERKDGYLIDEATLGRYWALSRSEGLSSDDERIAPLRAGDFSLLPPTRVHVAEFDPLRDEGVRLAERAGGRATLHPGLIHHFYGLTAVIPAARAALGTSAADLAAGLAS